MRSRGSAQTPLHKLRVAALLPDFPGLESASFKCGVDFTGEFSGFPLDFPLFPNAAAI
jgi:hypothetical protein